MRERSRRTEVRGWGGRRWRVCELLEYASSIMGTAGEGGEPWECFYFEILYFNQHCKRTRSCKWTCTTQRMRAAGIQSFLNSKVSFHPSPSSSFFLSSSFSSDFVFSSSVLFLWRPVEVKPDLVYPLMKAWQKSCVSEAQATKLRHQLIVFTPRFNSWILWGLVAFGALLFVIGVALVITGYRRRQRDGYHSINI